MLHNIYWILPEVFMAMTGIILLAYGGVLSKLGSQVSQLNKMNWLIIITLVLSSFLLIGQLGFEGNSNIIIAGGFFVTNEFIIAIKLVLVLSSALVLILGLLVVTVLTHFNPPVWWKLVQWNCHLNYRTIPTYPLLLHGSCWTLIG